MGRCALSPLLRGAPARWSRAGAASECSGAAVWLRPLAGRGLAARYARASL